MGPRRKKDSNGIYSLHSEDQMDEECDFKRGKLLKHFHFHIITFNLQYKLINILTLNNLELKVLQNEFRKTKSFKVSKLGPHYEELEKTMLSSAHSSTRNNIIIYGLPGFGRKSSVRYAIK